MKELLVVALSVVCCLSIQSRAASVGHFDSKGADDFEVKEAHFEGVGGRMVHDILSHDPECHLENNTMVYSDGSATSVISDHDAGLSLVLFSSDPGVCYIRDITAEDAVAQNKVCVDQRSATVTRLEGQEEQTVSGFQAGEEKRVEDLPASLQVHCAGRRVVSLQPAPVPSERSASGLAGPGARMMPVARCRWVAVVVRVEIRFNCQCTTFVCFPLRCQIRFEYQTRSEYRC